MEKIPIHDCNRWNDYENECIFLEFSITDIYADGDKASFKKIRLITFLSARVTRSGSSLLCRFDNLAFHQGKVRLSIIY